MLFKISHFQPNQFAKPYQQTNSEVQQHNMMQNSNQLQSYYNQSNNQQQIFDGNMLQLFC